MHAMLWAKNRITELAHLSDIAAGCSEGEGGLTVRRHKENPKEACAFLQATGEWIDLTVKKKSLEHAKGKRRGWEGWLTKSMKEGAAGIHAWVKREEEGAEVCVEEEGRCSAAPADIVEADFQSWKSIWEGLKRWQGTPWRQGQGEAKVREEEGLPDFGAKEVRKAAATFSARTGWGTDNVGPRQFMWLSDALLESVATLLKCIEAEGLWPVQVQEALIHLIPKPTGGRRPVGLIAALPRIWDRIRRPVVVRWRDTCARGCNWMVRGSGAERAVWAQSVEEEAAIFEGKKSAAVLIDLVKDVRKSDA